jgi:hypothetical protein
MIISRVLLSKLNKISLWKYFNTFSCESSGLVFEKTLATVSTDFLIIAPIIAILFSLMVLQNK